MRSRCMSLLPRTTLHSDSEQYLTAQQHTANSISVVLYCIQRMKDTSLLHVIRRQKSCQLHMTKLFHGVVRYSPSIPQKAVMPRCSHFLTYIYIQKNPSPLPKGIGMYCIYKLHPKHYFLVIHCSPQDTVSTQNNYISFFWMYVPCFFLNQFHLNPSRNVQTHRKESFSSFILHGEDTTYIDGSQRQKCNSYYSTKKLFIVD